MRPGTPPIGILGAGSVGLALAAALLRAGERPLLVTRREQAADELGLHGLEVENPFDGGLERFPVEAVCGIAAAASLRTGLVFVTTRTEDTDRAGVALARHAPDAWVVSLQNDLHNGALLHAHLRVVVAGVWRQTCTRVGERRVRCAGSARVVLGAETNAGLEAAGHARDRLAAAGLDVALSLDIRADQWLKLCMNLMSTPNALVRREDHASEAFVELKARLLEEARDALAAAGLRAASCDGGDRGLEEEIAHQRASLAAGTSQRPVPLYNNIWTALAEQRPLEADAYHRRILTLAERVGTAAPRNARVLQALLDAAHARRGPESVSAASLLADA